jgi:hypothetical protein
MQRGSIILDQIELDEFRRLPPIPGAAIKFWQKILARKNLPALFNGEGVYKFWYGNGASVFNYSYTTQLKLKNKPKM